MEDLNKLINAEIEKHLISIPDFNNKKCKVDCNCIDIAECKNGGNPVKSYECLKQ